MQKYNKFLHCTLLSLFYSTTVFNIFRTYMYLNLCFLQQFRSENLKLKKSKKHPEEPRLVKRQVLLRCSIAERMLSQEGL